MSHREMAGRKGKEKPQRQAGRQAALAGRFQGRRGVIKKKSPW